MAERVRRRPGRRARPVGVRPGRRRAARRLGRRRDPGRPARGRPLPGPGHPGHRHRQRGRQPVDRARQPGQAVGRARPADRRGARASSTACSTAPTCCSPASGPARSTASASDVDEVRARYPRLVYARGHGYGVRGPDAGPRRLRRLGVLGARRRGPRAHAARPRPPDLASGARSATATAAWRSPSASPPRCCDGPGPARGRSSTCRCWPPRCGRCRPTCSPRCRARRHGPPRVGSMVNPLVGTYRTKDGRHIQLVFLESDRYWATVLRAGRPARPGRRSPLRRPPRPASENAEACVAVLDEVFAAADLRRVEGAAGAGSTRRGRRCRRSRSCSTTRRCRQRLPRRRRARRRHAATGCPGSRCSSTSRPPDLRRAPEHGEHTEAVLLELGYSWDDIAALGEAGVIP